MNQDLMIQPVTLPEVARRAQTDIERLAESFAVHAEARMLPALQRMGLSREHLVALGRERMAELVDHVGRDAREAYISKTVEGYRSGRLANLPPLALRYGDHIQLLASQKLALLQWMGISGFNVASILSLAAELEALYADLEDAFAEAYAEQHRTYRSHAEVEAIAHKVPMADPASEERLLAQVSRALSFTGSLEQVLEHGLSNLCSLLNAAHGAVWLWDDTAKGLQIVSHYKLEQADIPAINAAYRAREGNSPVLEAFRRKETISFSDAFANLADAGLHHLAIWLDFRGALYSPLVYEGRALGTVTLFFRDPLNLPPREYRLLSMFTEQMAVAAIEVAERADNERLQQEQIDQLRQLDALKDQFLNILSHEMRTPMVSIMGFGSILLDGLGGDLSPAQVEYLRKMLSGADIMLKLVDDLLNMSQIQAGRFTIDQGPMRLLPVVRDAVESLMPQATQKELSLRNEVGDDLPPLWADDGRIRQVIVNLVSNAIKFTPKGGSVVVRAVAHSDYVRCEVVDTGIGIAESDQSKLFQRFSQIDGTSTRQAGGIGLGLSISKAIVEAHGGQIGVLSEPGHGSTFWFTLGLQPMGASAEAPGGKDS